MTSDSSSADETEAPEKPSGSGLVIWFFGLSGAGKSTLSSLTVEWLRTLGKKVVALDGDDLRSGLCSDLGFGESDRRENIRRAAHVARILSRSGDVVVASFITPKEELRSLARDIVGEDCFLGTYLRCSYEVCARRDVKGLYVRASQNQLANFTGKDSAFEEPGDCEVILDTAIQSREESLACLKREVVRRLQPG